jgi:acetylornithine deacetylase/succinyl-diaminopimelate desuccinylase-like protein
VPCSRPLVIALLAASRLSASAVSAVQAQSPQTTGSSASAATTASDHPSVFTPAVAERADVKRALVWLESDFPAHQKEWIRIAQMQAKSEHEQQRGRYVAAEMRKQGLTVRVDSIGNVIGVRKGAGGGPTVVFAAHMDIVHPLGTDLTVHRSGDTLRAPGIFDNSASVANMLAAIRALNAAKVKTKGDLVFIGTTQEELGFRGMDYWLAHNPDRADMLVGMDGGLGPIDYGALGIYWTKYVFRAAGSHTLYSAGKPHPARAAAEAIQRIYDIKVPEGSGGAVYNIGQVHGGTIFNGIPQELFITMDLRSVNPKLLDSLDREITDRVRQAAENQRVSWEKQVVQHSQAGGTEEMLAGAREHPIVQTAVDIHRFLGIDLGPQPAEASGSTDANAAVVRGIPAISVGRSFGGNQHTLSEWADAPSALPATKMVLLLAVSLGDNGPTRSKLDKPQRQTTPR